MIIWLASYPKSGNTWVRLFLDCLIQPRIKFNINHNIIGQFPLRSHFKNLSNNINNQQEFAKYCIKAQEEINLKNKLRIFKTHNAFWNFGDGQFKFTNEINTLGIIYIVRDPRNIVTSVLNYFHKKNYDEAIKFLSENKVLGGDSSENGLPTIIGSWKNHYNSWKKFKKNYILIKYENLLKNPMEEFVKITDFLEIHTDYKFEKIKIIEAIKNCSFNNLSNQEDKFGFNDNSKKNKNLNKKFFNLGPENKWENLLEEKIRLKIETLFQIEMKELKYL